MEQLQEKPSLTIQDWLPRVRRHRRWLMLSLFLGWAAVTTVGLLLPAKYRSDTVILVVQQSVPEHYVQANVVVDLQQRLQSMTEQILSRTRLLGIIEKFHLYSTQRQQADPDGLLDKMRKDIGIELVKGGARGDQLTAFKISYSAGSPTVAQQVTAELTSLFIDENLRNREKLSEDTTAFLENQLDEARKNLDQQEQRLREFKSHYLGQLPEQMQSNLQILTGLQSRMQLAADGLNQAEQQKLYLQSMVNEYRAFRPVVTGGNGKQQVIGPAEFGPKLERLKSQLAELSSKYTPAHPDVLRLKQEIAATEKQKAQFDEQVRSQKTPEGGQSGETMVGSGDLQTMSPLMQIQGQLKANELEIANRKREIAKLEAQLESYQARLNLTPTREQELAAITRDHEQSRANYESLLAKRNQSEMATNLEKRQQGEQFRMIDPPSLPQKPYSPNRMYFSLGGLAVGAVLGLGIVFLIEMSSPRVYSESELKGLVPVSVLISVPSLPTVTEQRRQNAARIAEMAVAGVMLIVIPSTTLFFFFKG